MVLITLLAKFPKQNLPSYSLNNKAKCGVSTVLALQNKAEEVCDRLNYLQLFLPSHNICYYDCSIYVRYTTISGYYFLYGLRSIFPAMNAKENIKKKRRWEGSENFIINYKMFYIRSVTLHQKMLRSSELLT